VPRRAPCLRRARGLAAFGFALLLGCGSGGGGSVPPPEDVLTPDSVDFEIVESETRRTLQVVEMTFEADDCEVEEGAVVEPGLRRLLRFDTVVANMGALHCRVGDPSDPEPPVSPDAFEFHDCHGHFHLEGWASYSLELPDGTLAAIGHKQSFCITDTVRVVPGSPRMGFTCGFQGISSGWADVYDRGVPGQWVDVSGLPGGAYVLVLEVNPDGVLVEADDRRANTLRVDVTLPDPSAAVEALDDHADVVAQATGMPSPAGFQAALQTGGDLDWFRIEAQAGVTYVVRTELLGLPDSRLRLFEADGTTPIGENDDVVPAVDLSSRVEFSVPTTRPVTIEVSGPGGATGRYRLIVE
jgi:hypothetical protein